MHYIACDLHKQVCSVCVVDDVVREQEYPLPEEAIVLEEEMRSTRIALARLLNRVREIAGESEPLTVVVETNSSWYWFVDYLEPLVDEVKLVNAEKAKAIASARIKTDKLDARVLAWLARNKLIPEVYIPPKALRDTRELLRYRSYLVRTRTRLKAKIQSQLEKLGISHEFSDLFGKGGREWLGRLRAREPYKLTILGLLDVVNAADRKIEEAEKEIFNGRLKLDRETELLKTLPGFGDLFAGHARLEILDIKRFAGHKNFVRYCGLAPGTYQSAKRKRRKGLVKQANHWLKWIYVEAAHHAARHPCFEETYRRQCAKNGKAVAKLTVARRLAIATYYMLKEGEAFRGAA
ncbi:MAG: IS110 family transposase [Planctomycetota bacterium]|nr:IS110 family transposase [Planctomycetota bacterium]